MGFGIGSERKEKVRRKREAGQEIEKAVRNAVDECISEDILADFFRGHREEVIEMGIFEFEMSISMMMAARMT